MSRPVWSSDLTDLAAISATHRAPAGYHELYAAGGPTWEAAPVRDAYPRLLPASRPVSGDGERDISPYMTSPIPSPDRRANYHVAPEAYALPHAALLAEPNIDLSEPTNHVPNDLHPTYTPNVATNPQASPSATSEHASMYSPSPSDASDSHYPSSDPRAYTALANSSRYVAQPLLSTTGDYLVNYFANPEENLCLFADITAQLDEEPESPTSSASPAPPTTPSAVANHTAPNYSGPIRNTIVNMSTDKNGVVWISFPYSKNKQIKNHTIRCDVENVPPSKLKKEIKSVSAAVRLPFDP